LVARKLLTCQQPSELLLTCQQKQMYDVSHDPNTLAERARAAHVARISTDGAQP
jgi:hypothetical protein